ncbi:hypothetical protein [Streptomyces sp. ODS05-4]|uniref:hypothetical protein n=1 Tax=Streptomyces sp. ODS05-4 TaxID=2944939 RepID=UPI00210C6BC8|nr:hypothetical protein [Streptomyces sp. ODS05-4]
MPTPAAPGPAHTRARPVHWLTTAALTAATIAAAALLGPGAATATPPGAPAPGRAAPADATPPDAAAADYPLRCPGAGATVVRTASGDLDGDGRPETVAAARCAAGSGTPPTGLYVLTGDGTGGARIVATLVDPAERLTLQTLDAHAGAVTAVLLGYSSPSVPRCCPDTRQTVTWHWRDGAFQRTAGDPVDPAAPSPRAA